MKKFIVSGQKLQNRKDIFWRILQTNKYCLLWCLSFQRRCSLSGVLWTQVRGGTLVALTMEGSSLIEAIRVHDSTLRRSLTLQSAGHRSIHRLWLCVVLARDGQGHWFLCGRVLSLNPCLFNTLRLRFWLSSCRVLLFQQRIQRLGSLGRSHYPLFLVCSALYYTGPGPISAR